LTRILRNRLNLILDELRDILGQVDPHEVDELVLGLQRAEKIFVYGQGRTGHISRAFAVRLMHLGRRAHFVGETTVPRISPRDLCLVNSGSGTTRFVYHVASVAREAGAKVATITAHPEGPIARIADIVVTVPAPTKGESSKLSGTRQPPGSLFEQACLILLDAVVLVLMDRLKITPRMLAKRHANIE
jgi:6-phospho-3-hexuloisomerase